MSTEALKLLIEECERANATGLREFGIGVIDLNAISGARAALAAQAERQVDAAAAYAIASAHLGMGPETDRHSDDAAVDRFAARMKWKLAQKRNQGLSGWQDRAWTPEMISQALREHVEKGDPLDVANYCMFLAARNEPIAPAPASQAERFDWSDFRTITDLPEVYETIRALLDDQTEDNAACMVRAIIEAAGDRLVQLSTQAQPQDSEREPLGKTAAWNLVRRAARQLAPGRGISELLAAVDAFGAACERTSKPEDQAARKLLCDDCLKDST
jgi:hypothetical protein